MSRRRRGRVTVQHQRTGAGRAMVRLMGVIHAIFGLGFVGVALTQIIPGAGLIGLPFLAVGAFFAINGIRLAVSKNDVAHQVGYDIETDVEEETILGLMEEADRKSLGTSFDPSPQHHQHIASIGPDPKQRMKKLQELRDSGFITQQEYDQKRREILSEL